jgi:hypothetical protein
MNRFLFREAEAQKPSLRGLSNSIAATFSHLQAGQNGSSLNGFGKVLRSWQMVNYWNSFQLSRATSIASHSKAAISEQEIKNIVSGMSIHPSITLFKALAAIHQSITAGHSSDPLLQYAMPLSTDASGNSPSWWFALFCDEDWVLDKIAIPLNWSPPENFSEHLSVYIRKQITGSGKDIISDILPLLQNSFRLNSVEHNRLRMWILGIVEIKNEEMHDYIHGLVGLCRLCNSPSETVYSLMNSI